MFRKLWKWFFEMEERSSICWICKNEILDEDDMDVATKCFSNDLGVSETVRKFHKSCLKNIILNSDKYTKQKIDLALWCVDHSRKLKRQNKLQSTKTLFDQLTDY